LKSTNINSCSSNDNENVTHKRVDGSKKNIFKCACGIVYHHFVRLRNHIDNKTKSVTCPRCSKVLVGSYSFKRHFKTRGCRERIISNNSNINNNDHNNNDFNNNFDDDNENKDTSKSLLHAKSSTTSSSIPSNSRGIVIIVSYSILLLSLS